MGTMEENISKKLNYIKKELRKEREYLHAATIIEFDQMTICPPDGQKSQGDSAIRVMNHAFRIRKSAKFIESVIECYGERESLYEADKVLVEELYKSYVHDKFITPELNEEFSRIGNEAWVAWSKARDDEDVSEYLPKLSNVIDSKKKYVSIALRMPGEEHLSDYEFLLNKFEEGMDTATIDRLFDSTKEIILDLLEKIKGSEKSIRTDFLSRPVKDSQQEEMAKYLMGLMGFDFKKGQMSVSEHPFTSLISKNDVRITTHFYPNSFISSIYSVIHECGHALFEQLLPREDHEYFIEDLKTMGMHESVSRFYENVLGRSKEFIHLIYPAVCRIFPQAMRDVTEDELYEAVNYVTPSLIRTEADELTYTLHIIIRYELEKRLIDGNLTMEELPGQWNRLYKEYLGVEPVKDSEGLLQDVHWTTDFGYFPTYAIGNFYNAMYLNKMKEEFDPFEAVGEGDFAKINTWMKEHVFKKANRLKPTDWIKDITGREITADDFIIYLKDKYSNIYQLVENKKVEGLTNEYVNRVRRIRKLSSPSLEAIDSPDEYSDLLRENFKEIGKLALENRNMIKKYVRPLLGKEFSFSDVVVNAAITFCSKLTDPNHGLGLDASLALSISCMMMDDASKSGDDEYYLKALDMVVANSYLMVNQTKRLVACPEVAESFRKIGLYAYEEIVKYLEKDKFVLLSDEYKTLVLIDSRYGPVLYEYMKGYAPDVSKINKRIELIEDSIKIARDPFYREAFPSFNWNKHLLKAYEFILVTTPCVSDKECIKKIEKYARELEEFGRCCPEEYEKVFPLEYIFSITEDIRYAAGKCDRYDHLKRMYTIWRFADKRIYDRRGGDNLIAAASYIDVAADGELTAEMKSNITDMYKSVTEYAFRIPMLEYISSVIGIYSGMLLRFVEIQGGMTFEEFGLKVMAAFHPPTYIHSVMVARISVCLCERLMKKNPELFIGVCGCPSADKVDEYKDAILHLVHHSAMCHDFGKLVIIDTVFVYGRELLPSELPIIKSHSLMGWELLRKYESTKAYAEVAAGHHVYYDGSNGYPESFDIKASPLKSVIDIVTVADCMDAATDYIGRSYSEGKNLDEFVLEVSKESGTRYSPYVIELLTDKEVFKDMEYILNTERRKVYKETYMLLKHLSAEEVNV
ncbi:MAG: HD domain-containing protein [Lachnospiraceae bacterium]|nr:HD domain-containing protein [Lachnospiraceae bacterium]